MPCALELRTQTFLYLSKCSLHSAWRVSNVAWVSSAPCGTARPGTASKMPGHPAGAPGNTQPCLLSHAGHAWTFIRPSPSGTLRSTFPRGPSLPQPLCSRQGPYMMVMEECSPAEAERRGICRDRRGQPTAQPWQLAVGDELTCMCIWNERLGPDAHGPGVEETGAEVGERLVWEAPCCTGWKWPPEASQLPRVGIGFPRNWDGGTGPGWLLVSRARRTRLGGPTPRPVAARAASLPHQLGLSHLRGCSVPRPH